MKTKSTYIIMQNKVFLWIVAGITAKLSVPLIVQRYYYEVAWSFLDFAIMSILLFGMSAMFVFVARVTPRQHRTLIGIGFVVLLLLVWVHLAVGIVDTWPLAGS